MKDPSEPTKPERQWGVFLLLLAGLLVFAIIIMVAVHFGWLR